MAVASAFPTASLAPVPCSAVSARRRSVSFPEFSCLKIQSIKSNRSLSYSSGVGRRGRIVCEAQGTTVEAVTETAEAAASETAVAAVTDETWQTLVLESKLPVLVEFWAPSCKTSRIISPYIDELVNQYQGYVNIYKLNTEEAPTIATQYGIKSTPTVLIFKDGETKVIEV